MGVSRYSFVLAVIAALVIGFLLGAAQTPASATPSVSAAQFSAICPLVDRASKPLTAQDLNVKGDTRCWYGTAHDPNYPCNESSVSNAMLWKADESSAGQTKCVYRSFIVRPTQTPLTGPTQTPTPELTNEATP